jgi:hypothetical protein
VTWPATQALTVFAEIAPARRLELERLLAQIHDHLDDNAVLRPGELPDTHFTRFVIIDDAKLPALLCWESNHDGKRDDYAIACWRACGAGLAAIFACCVDWDADDTESFASWVGRHAVRSEAFYCGYRAVPRAQVVNDRAVHDEIRRFLDAHRASLIDLPPAEIQARIRAHLVDRGLEVAPQDEGDTWWKIATWLFEKGKWLVLALALPFAWPGWLYLRRLEDTDVPEAIDAPVHADPRLLAEEDQVAQNQLTLLTEVKPGWFRLFVLRAVLVAISIYASVEYVYGNLGGITSIHYARWVLIPDRNTSRRRLLFLSNYDGSWDAYLGEFIDRASNGLTAVWSNAAGFPRTRQLIRGGARDEEAFKQWVRRRQIYTDVWWSGVPDASVQNVRDDVWIRRRIAQELDDEETTTWLRRL